VTNGQRPAGLEWRLSLSLWYTGLQPLWSCNSRFSGRVIIIIIFTIYGVCLCRRSNARDGRAAPRAPRHSARIDGNRPWTLSMKRRVTGCGRRGSQPGSLSRGSSARGTSRSPERVIIWYVSMVYLGSNARAGRAAPRAVELFELPTATGPGRSV
jgi:hypothetical protein